MEPIEIILIAVLGGGIVAALAAVVVVQWRKTNIAWKPLPYRPGMWYCFESSGSVQMLTQAIDFAVQALVAYTKWTKPQIESAIADLHVHVKSTEVWTENTGDARGAFQTAGLQMDSGVRVGPSLSALCHEIAHRVEQVIDGRIDYTHAGWATNGIYAAVEQYDAAMTRTLQP